MENLVQTGSLLLSDPFLKDPNFSRTAVLVCEHDTSGTVGFIVNKRFEQHLGELVEAFENTYFPLYYGGPVQNDTLHFLHCQPELLGGMEINDGIFWGGDFDEVEKLLKQQLLNESDIRFFVGYSGWGKNQLQSELAEKSWIVTESNKSLVFTKNIQHIWKKGLMQLGGEYALMANYPIDPQLN